LASPSAPSPIPTFRHPVTLSTIADVTPGFTCRQAQRRSTKIPLDWKLCPVPHRFRSDASSEFTA
jgi:hypothetical protein